MGKVKRYDLDGGMLYHGDCLDVMRGMPDNTVDLVFGSPPYEDARLYLEDGEDLGVSRCTDEWVAWMVEVFTQATRVSKGLVAFVVGHGIGQKTWSAGPILLMGDLKRKGFNLRRPVIYQRDGLPGTGGDDWLRANYEWIVCVAPRDLPWSDNTACGRQLVIPHKPINTPPKRYKDGKRAKPNSRDLERPPPKVANPGSIIYCGTVGFVGMGSNVAFDNEAPFPEKLPDFFIRSYCQPGGVVYDPFGGSGTTMAVAMIEGRKFICSDLRESQVRLMFRRYQQSQLRKGLF